METKETFVQAVTEALVKDNVISHEEALALQKAFKDSEKPYFDDFLLGGGLVDKAALLKALSSIYQVPAFDLVGYFFKRKQLLLVFQA